MEPVAAFLDTLLFWETKRAGRGQWVMRAKVRKTVQRPWNMQSVKMMPAAVRRSTGQARTGCHATKVSIDPHSNS